MISGGHQALFNGIAAVKDDFNVFIAYEAWNSDEYKETVKSFLQKMPNVTLLPMLYEPPVSISAKRRFKKNAKTFVKKLIGIRDISVIEDKNNKTIEWWKYTITPVNRLWIEHIADIVSKYRFDYIQVEMPWRISDVFALPNDAKKIYVHHELGFVRREQELSEMKESKEYASVLKSFVDMNEINQLNLYDGIITLSSIDSDKLIKAGVKKPIYSSFAIIDVPKMTCPILGDGKRLTFIGPDFHNPNYVGISWFLENCWRKLKEREPEITLDIIGKWTEKNVTFFSAKYNDVNFLGFVDDLNTILQGSTMIVPITIGSGIRMKILEAASNGIPFVSTIVGVEGIPLEDGKDCFLTDDPNVFVEDILKLFEKKLRLQFIENAKVKIKENYSLESLRRNRLAIYNNLH
jgi:glycosyltransferase involved in cell wall biosynthesis